MQTKRDEKSSEMKFSALFRGRWEKEGENRRTENPTGICRHCAPDSVFVHLFTMHILSFWTGTAGGGPSFSSKTTVAAMLEKMAGLVLHISRTGKNCPLEFQPKFNKYEERTYLVPCEI